MLDKNIGIKQHFPIVIIAYIIGISLIIIGFVTYPFNEIAGFIIITVGFLFEPLWFLIYIVFENTLHEKR